MSYVHGCFIVYRIKIVYPNKKVAYKVTLRNSRRTAKSLVYSICVLKSNYNPSEGSCRYELFPFQFRFFFSSQKRKYCFPWQKPYGWAYFRQTYGFRPPYCCQRFRLNHFCTNPLAPVHLWERLISLYASGPDRKGQGGHSVPSLRFKRHVHCENVLRGKMGI